jgi:MoaA/NifB/PqqE/SkfB family radical SAM enzyme
MSIEVMEDRLRRIYAADHRLLSLHIDVLYQCDLDCCHCYLDDKRTETLSTERLVALLGEARDLGALKLTLSGGELFLRRDLFELLEEARRLRYYIKLKSHGGLITERKADRLAELAIGRVELSVYALDASVHDAITRRTGSLERTLKGIERLRERGIDVRVNCSVMHGNRLHYEELVRVLEERGISVSLDGSIRGTNSGTLETYALGLDTADKVALERFRRAQRGGVPEPVSMDPDDHICWAGKTSAYVMPDGAVTPCVAWPMPVGHLASQSLREIWEDAPALHEIRAARRRDRAGCGSCSLTDKCIYCPGKAWIETQGDWLAPFELQCQDTATRVYGTLAYSAELVRGGRPRRAEFPIVTSPEAPPAGPAKVRLPPEAVERAARDQRGAPRRKVFRILSEDEVRAAHIEAAASAR